MYRNYLNPEEDSPPNTSRELEIPANHSSITDNRQTSGPALNRTHGITKHKTNRKQQSKNIQDAIKKNVLAYLNNEGPAHRPITSNQVAAPEPENREYPSVIRPVPLRYQRRTSSAFTPRSLDKSETKDQVNNGSSVGQDEPLDYRVKKPTQPSGSMDIPQNRVPSGLQSRVQSRPSAASDLWWLPYVQNKSEIRNNAEFSGRPPFYSEAIHDRVLGRPTDSALSTLWLLSYLQSKLENQDNTRNGPSLQGQLLTRARGNEGSSRSPNLPGPSGNRLELIDYRVLNREKLEDKTASKWTLYMPPKPRDGRNFGLNQSELRALGCNLRRPPVLAGVFETGSSRSQNPPSAAPNLQETRLVIRDSGRTLNSDPLPNSSTYHEQK